MSVPSPRDKSVVQDPLSRALHNLADLGIITTDNDLRVTGWNRWMEIKTGTSAADVVGHNLIELYPQLAERRQQQHYEQALYGRVVVLAQRFHKYLIPMPINAGTSMPPLMQQSVRIAPLFDDNDAAIGTVTVIEDVTERVDHDSEIAKHARRQTAVSMLGQAALVGSQPEVLLNEACRLTTSTLDVEIAAVFEQAHRSDKAILRAAFGLATTDIGKEFTLSQGPRHFSDALLEGSGTVVTTSPELNCGENSLFGKDAVKSCVCIAIPGSNQQAFVLTIYSTAEREFDGDEIEFLRTIASVIGMSQNRYRLLAELESKVNDLAIADQRKDEFLAMLGHELRNPLAPIKNAVELLRNNSVDESQRSWATAVIDRQLMQMTRLVDDLLDVARITRGKVSLRKATVDIGALVTRAMETSQHLIDSRGHKLTVSLPPQPLLIDGDITRLAQVVANLLNNAAKYTEEGGQIALAVTNDKTHAQISVKDSGVGIAKEMLTSVFDLFTQVNPALDRKEGGLGIGLTLSRTLVSMHDGTLSVESQGRGKGSEFIVRLPLPKQPIDQVESQPPAVHTTSAQRTSYRVLVVDDNLDAANLMKLLLQTLGHQATCVYDGPAAIDHLAHSTPDVVILDIGLPGMSGYEVAETIRQTHGLSIVIVALTGYGQEEDRRRTKESGFDHHLVKPIAVAELNSLLQRL